MHLTIGCFPIQTLVEEKYSLAAFGCVANGLRCRNINFPLVCNSVALGVNRTCFFAYETDKCLDGAIQRARADSEGFV